MQTHRRGRRACRHRISHQIATRQRKSCGSAVDFSGICPVSCHRMSTAIEQPYAYRHRELVEPDWTRLPGWRDVTAEDWASAQWQRAHCVKNIRQLRELMGDLLTEAFYADLERDQAERATMSMLVPPQMMNTMVARPGPTARCRPPAPSSPGRSTPTRCAATCSRCSPTAAPTGRRHPHATRDSLHEHDMWVAEGLTHRYPTKVLAELLPTCPQYCGHCTRMDLVGNSTPQVDQAQARRQAGRPVCRDARLPAAHARRCATSSSPAATWPTCRGRTSRGSSTGCSSRQHPRHPAGHQGAHGPAAALAAGRRRRGRRPRVAPRPASRGVSLAIHTHVNSAQSVTPAGGRRPPRRCSTPACATCATRAS